MTIPTIVHFKVGIYPYTAVKAPKPCNTSYLRGNLPPRFPVPAIPTRVGYMPPCANTDYPSAYIYVSTSRYLWTFWEHWGLIEERC